MRRLTAAALALALTTLLAPGCKHSRKARAKSSEDDGQLASVVNVADPRASVQLVRGFYNLEANTWRWTMGKFTVSLRPPAGAAQNGAKLELKFNIPDVVFNQIGAITLTAAVNGLALPPEAYNKAGNFTYARDVPGAALAGDAVAVDFATDKVLPPSAQDSRELCLIVTSIGLAAK
jgi:hypothetical protein